MFGKGCHGQKSLREGIDYLVDPPIITGEGGRGGGGGF